MTLHFLRYSLSSFFYLYFPLSFTSVNYDFKNLGPLSSPQPPAITRMRILLKGGFFRSVLWATIARAPAPSDAYLIITCECSKPSQFYFDLSHFLLMSIDRLGLLPFSGPVDNRVAFLICLPHRCWYHVLSTCPSIFRIVGILCHLILL